MKSSFTCLDIVKAAELTPGRKSGSELLYCCPRHDDQHPSLTVNPEKDVWLCPPCGAKGTAWQLLAFIGGIDPADKPAVYRLLDEYGLSNGNGSNQKNGKGNEQRKSRLGAIVAIYDYPDETGAVLYQVVRYDPKDFRQRRPDGNGRYIWKLDGVRRVPYRLPELRRAVDVFICEGEKDADNLSKLGLTATSMTGGTAASAGADGERRVLEFAACFQAHQHVVVLPHNDDTGRHHARRVAEALMGKVSSLKILDLSGAKGDVSDLPGLPDKGDVSDWLAGKELEGAAEELAKMAEAAPEWAQTSEAESKPSYIEFAPAFLTVVDPPVEHIIPEITPKGCLKCSHGDPRTMKSLGALEEAIAGATGTPAFGLERFRPSRTFKTLYSSQEDAAREVRSRAIALLRGRGIETLPENLAFAVHKGIDLESADWQQRLIEDVLRYRFEHVTFDPIRRFTLNSDKGPAEVARVTAFLRRLIVQTGATVHIVHHDTKPPNSGPDTRRRSHRASGGDWFAASECPVAFEKIGDGQSLVIPEDYKFSADPQSFTIRYTEENGGTIVRLVGEDATAEQALNLALDEKILTYLGETPGASGNAIVKGCRARREAVLDALNRLFQANKVDCAQKGKAKLWTIRRSE